MTGERNDKLKKVMFLWVLLEDNNSLFMDSGQ